MKKGGLGMAGFSIGLAVELCLAAAALAQPAETGALPFPGATPVNARDLAGNALAPQRWNFSLAAPGPGWAWWKLPQSAEPGKSESFACIGPGNERFLLASKQNSAGVVNEEFVRGVMNGFTRTGPKSGMVYSNLKSEPSEIPIHGSYRITGACKLPQGIETDWTCYVIGNDPIYLIQAYFPTGADTSSFTAFVSGFHNLRAAPAPATPRAGGSTGEPLFGGIFIVLLCMGVGWIFNKILKRPAVNGALVGVAAALVVGIGLSIFIASAPRFSGLAPEKQGELLGRTMGPYLIGAVLGAVFAARFSKRKKATRPR